MKLLSLIAIFFVLAISAVSAQNGGFEIKTIQNEIVVISSNNLTESEILNDGTVLFYTKDTDARYVKCGTKKVGTIIASLDPRIRPYKGYSMEISCIEEDLTGNRRAYTYIRLVPLN